MSNEQMEALRQALDDAVLTHTGRSIGDLASGRVLTDIMPEIEALLRTREAEWDSKEQALQKSIAEHGRVIAAIEARYEEQGQYNHELVRRLVALKEIAEFVAGEPYYKWPKGYSEQLDLSNKMQDKARALLAQNGEERGQ